MSENKDPRLVDGIEEIKEIPTLATQEIHRLWKELQLARETFATYVKTVRLSLGIPATNTPDNYWDMSTNAQYFLRISDAEAATINSAVAAKAAQTAEAPVEKHPIPEGEDTGSVCDNTYEVKRANS